ncbi:MAG TPA: hypothetical protein VMB50_02080 [Myxococcales bacterium]|nr:hypothetical protein [Myxococcales bacterium]
MRTIGTVVTALAIAAGCCALDCGGGGGGTNGTTSSGGNPGGNNGGCGAPLKWNLVTLDGTADGGSALDDLEIAVGPNDVVGVGYLQDTTNGAATGQDAGTYDVRYVQYDSASGTASQPQLIDQIQNTYGVSVAISPSGQPAVAYLGGPPYGGAGAGASHYWYNSAAIVQYQNAGGAAWTSQTADDGMADPDGPTTQGGQANVTSDYQATGPSVVGLYSALGFDSTGVAYDYFRDVLYGQSIGTSSDFGSSRIDGEVGGPTTWTPEWAFLGNTWDYEGGPVLGLGGHLHLVMANDQPALITDEFGQSAGAESGGQNVDFLMRLGPNNWSVPQRIISVFDTQTGPSLTWDKSYGFAATVFDQGTGKNKLYFASSTDGKTWSTPDDVYAGSGGWYPSVAINPTTGTPAIADFFCSTSSGVSNLASCPKSQRSLEVRTLYGVSWCTAQQVDPAGGYQPKLAFLSGGNMVIAYRQLDAQGKPGPLVLAVQQ